MINKRFHMKWFTIIISFLFFGTTEASNINAVTLENKAPFLTEGTTFYVDDDYNQSTPGWNITHFARIVDALPYTTDGDMILIFCGEYDERFTITTQISLIGVVDENETYPKILGEFMETTMIVNADNCTFEYLDIANEDLGEGRNLTCGIWLNSNNNSIQNCISRNNGINLYLNSSSNNYIMNNSFHTSGDGIYVTASSCNNTISNNIIGDHANYNILISGSNCDYNTFTNNLIEVGTDSILICGGTGNTFMNNTIRNSRTYGTCIQSSHFLTFKDNKFINNGIWLEADVDQQWLKSCTFENNTINDKLIYLYAYNTNIVVPPEAGQVILINCSNATVSHTEISNTDVSILVINSQNILIASNLLSQSTSWRPSIHLIRSFNINLTKNKFTSCPKCLELVSSQHVNILDNTIISCERGITIGDSEQILIKGNLMILSTEDGFIIGNSKNIYLQNNKILFAIRAIFIASDASNETVNVFLTANLFSRCLVAIHVIEPSTHRVNITSNTFKSNMLGIVWENARDIEIRNNNFFFNIVSATCRSQIPSRYLNITMSQNFWNRPHLLPKMIPGWLVFLIQDWPFLIILPTFSIDLKPRVIPNLKALIDLLFIGN